MSPPVNFGRLSMSAGGVAAQGRAYARGPALRQAATRIPGRGLPRRTTVAGCRCDVP